MMKVAALDEAMIDKKHLLPPGFAGKLGLADESADTHHVGHFLYRHQLGVEGAAEDADNPLPKVRAADPRAVARMREADAALAPAAERNDIDPLLLHAVAWVESRHRPDAVSPAGARGLMQVMPRTGARFGVQSERHLHDPAFNAAAAAASLKWLQGEFGNDLSLVLAAYNAGEGAVRRHGLRVPPYPETTAYVRDVLAVYRELSAQAGEIGTQGAGR